MQIPYTGYQYPMKNRGIKMIKKYIFHGRFPYKKSPDFLIPIEDDFDYNQSLWEFWKNCKQEINFEIKREKKRFQKMEHGEIIFEDNYIYVKWEEQGICVSVDIDEEQKTAEIDTIDLWHYPKANKISKNTIHNLKSIINTYFAQMGYSTKYIS